MSGVPNRNSASISKWLFDAYNLKLLISLTLKTRGNNEHSMTEPQDTFDIPSSDCDAEWLKTFIHVWNLSLDQLLEQDGHIILSRVSIKIYLFITGISN